MAQRAIWNGSISFGLINVPVKMYTGFSPKTVKFHQLNEQTGARIKQKRVDPTTDEEVNFEDIVKGYELSPGRYVMITADELEAIKPKKLRAITLEGFVPLSQVDPGAYDASYNLGPDLAALNGYRLLVEMLSSQDKAAIGRVIIREKEKICLVRARDGGLVMNTLAWADEMNPMSEVPEIDAIEGVEPNEREVEMAVSLMDALSMDFDHFSYQDSFRASVLELIEKKAAGEIIDMPEAEKETASAPDLMSALEASLNAVKKPAKKATKKSKAKVAA